jgi:outer membrane protein OmpA-like peptidoglycan-associated protein/chitodextrinase
MKKLTILCLVYLCLIWPFVSGQTDNYSIRITPFSSEKYDEFSPTFYLDGLVFCSNRKTGLFITYSGENNKENFNLLFVRPEDSLGWESSVLLAKELLTSYHDGPASFNKEMNVIYFTRNYHVENKLKDVSDLQNKLGIFSAEFNEGKWTNMKPFKYNDPNSSFLTPVLSRDESRLYFASDKPGGFGGADLYYCTRSNNDWEEPVNLGPAVKTSGNESFPFISDGGDLIFASDGHHGLGGKDIYYTREIYGQWITPIPLEPPINSAKDDFGLIATGNMEEGYFSSNRDESDDIYYFKTEFPQFFTCDSLQDNHYCFLFYDEGNLDLDTLPLRYEWDFGDGGKETGLEVEYCYSSPGEYTVQLSIIDNNTGNTFFTQSSYVFELKDILQPFINSPDVSIIDAKIRFDGLRTNLPDFNIAEYLWDFGDGYKQKGPEAEHSYNNTGEYIVQLGLLSDKDSLGISSKSCVYKKIIILEDYQAMAMHTAKAKGELTVLPEIEESDQSVVDNLYSYSDAFRQNATFRVEILTTDTQLSIDTSLFDPLRGEYDIKEVYLKGENVYSYTVGEEKGVLETYSIYNEMIALGYNNARVRSYILADMAEDELIELTRAFGEFADALFEFDKHRITSASYPILDRLVEIMNKYPFIKLEIAAHTDNMGSFEYNMNLSRRRVQSIVDYLVGKGISDHRIIGKGYGESRPIATNNTEEGREMNRRVEFIVINK